MSIMIDVTSKHHSPLIWMLGIALLMVSGSIAYYFGFFKPNFEQQKYDQLQIEKALEKIEEDKKEEAESAEKQINLATKLRADCLPSGKRVTPLFDEGTTREHPLFFPYDNIDAINKNERLVVAIGEFVSCMDTDPRYDRDNEAMLDFVVNAISAKIAIADHIEETIANNPTFCDSYILSQSAKQSYCE
jgi:hypothetical protein